LAITDIDLGVTHHLAGNLLEAKHAYADALLLAKELGLAITIQTASLNLGEVLLDMGDPHAAIKALVDGSNIVNGSRGILTMLSGLLAEALQSIGQQADVASRAVGIETSLEKMAVADPSITYYLNRLRKTVLSPREEADAPMRKFEQPKGSREDSRNS
jgi:hypothetical protein